MNSNWMQSMPLKCIKAKKHQDSVLYSKVQLLQVEVCAGMRDKCVLYRNLLSCISSSLWIYSFNISWDEYAHAAIVEIKICLIFFVFFFVILFLFFLYTLE